MIQTRQMAGFSKYISAPSISRSQNYRADKVLIIGLGQLGLPVAQYVKQRGFNVNGYDVNPEAVDRAKRVASIGEAPDFSGYDVYIICVSTHKQDDLFSPQIDGVISITRRLADQAKDGALVSIESTIPRGTSRRLFEMLGHRLHVAHVPHRWYALEENVHGVNQLRVAGGVQECCLTAAMDFYTGKSVAGGTCPSNLGPGTNETVKVSSRSLSLEIPLHPVQEIEVAEITKVAENAHRYLQIAFAEDLYLYCEANNLDFAQLRLALNTKWNVEILEPRDGIGGHCLPKDTKMFLGSSTAIKSKILTSAMEVDRDFRYHKKNRNLLLSSEAILKDTRINHL